jgi:maltose O-acetyltransferase
MSTPFSPSVRVGTPSEPPLSAYEHLTEKERMTRGFPYKPWVPELNANRLRGQKLTLAYNATSPGDTEKRRAILAELLHPDSKGKSMLVEPPFRVDYGDNIKVPKYLS